VIPDEGHMRSMGPAKGLHGKELLADLNKEFDEMDNDRVLKRHEPPAPKL
jgi:hypothetical protein